MDVAPAVPSPVNFMALSGLMPGAFPGAPHVPAQPRRRLPRQAALLLPRPAGGRTQGCKPTMPFAPPNSQQTLQPQPSRFCPRRRPPNPPDPQIELSSALFTLLRQTKATHPSPAAPRQKRICSGETPRPPPAAPDHAFPQTPTPPGSPGPRVPAAPATGDLPLPCTALSPAASFPPYPWGNGAVVAVVGVGGEQRAKSSGESGGRKRAGTGQRRGGRVLTGCEPWRSSSRRGCLSLGFPSLSLGGLWKERAEGLCEHPKHRLTS